MEQNPDIPVTGSTHPLPQGSPSGSSLRTDHIHTYPGTQRLGHDNRSIRLLTVFHHGDHRSTHGNGRSVERVNELGAFLPFDLVTAIEASSLIIGAVRGAGHLLSLIHI